MELPPGAQPVPARPRRSPARRPGRLGAWMAQAGRDARMLLDGLRGVHPSPLLPRAASRHAGRRDELRAGRPGPDALEQPLPQPRARPASEPRGSAVALVHLGGHAHAVTVQPDQTILEAALAAGLPMPFSCTLGGCGACKVVLRAGDVDLDEPNCLTPAERAAGHVLTCVGRPLGPITIEVDAE